MIMFFSKITFVLLVATLAISLFLGGGSAATQVIYPNQQTAVQHEIGNRQSAVQRGYGNHQYTEQIGSNNEQLSIQEMDVSQLPPLSNNRSPVKDFIGQLRAYRPPSPTISKSDRTRAERYVDRWLSDSKQSNAVSESENEQSTSQQENQISSKADTTHKDHGFVARWAAEHLKPETQIGSEHKQSTLQQKYLNQNPSEQDKILVYRDISQWLATNYQSAERNGSHDQLGQVTNGNLFQQYIGQISNNNLPNDNNLYEGRPFLIWLNNVFKWKLCIISGFTRC